MLLISVILLTAQDFKTWQGLWPASLTIMLQGSPVKRPNMQVQPHLGWVRLSQPLWVEGSMFVRTRQCLLHLHVAKHAKKRRPNNWQYKNTDDQLSNGDISLPYIYRMCRECVWMEKRDFFQGKENWIQKKCTHKVSHLYLSWLVCDNI